MDALRSCALLLASSLAAQAAPSPPSAPPVAEPAPIPEELEELDEIELTGVRRNRKPAALVSWLRRLVGEYRSEGYVELRDHQGASLGRQPVRGGAECVAFGEAPGVQCSMQMTWPSVLGTNDEEIPGGRSSLLPAMILYGLDPDYLAIHYLQVDNRGIADAGHGYLYGDTLSTRMPCADMPGDCERVTSITAADEGKLVQMQIDLNQGGVRLARYLFALHRVAGGAPPLRK